MPRRSAKTPPPAEVKRVLVTGAAGFIGSHLTDALLARGYDVVGVDNFLGNYDRVVKESNLTAALKSPRFLFRELDLSLAPLEPLVDEVDAVYHLAARPGVRDSWGEHYQEYLAHNVLATQRLLEALRAHPLKPLVLASSSSVYGDALKLPVNEKAIPAPVSPYGASKLAAEDLVHLYAQSYGLDPTILRFFTVYGPRQRPDMAIHKFVRAVAAGRTITLYGDDRDRRDFTYVADVVAAALAIVERGIRGGCYNVASGRTVPLADVVAMVEAAVGKKAKVERAPHQRGDVHATHGDIAALKRAVGYEPATPLAEGIAAEAAWLLETATAVPFPKGKAPVFGPPRRHPKLSVIIVNYNAGHVIANCLGSCWLNPPREGGMEVIVVDNASDDGSAEALAVRDDIIFLRNHQNLGYAAANNQGVAISRGEYLLLLNPDVEVGPGLFDALIAFLDENPDAAVAAPALVSPNGRLQESFRRFPNLFHLLGNRRSLIYRWWPHNPFSRRGFYLDLPMDRPARVDFVAGAVMMFKRTLVDLIGPMDRKYFMYVEDADFCRRARDAGLFTYFLPNLTALHHWGESSARHPYRMVFIHHISMMRYFRRHQPLQYAVYLLLLPLVGVHMLFELVQASSRARARRERIAREKAAKEAAANAPA